MTLSEARQLIAIGDKIKIVDKWPEHRIAFQNPDGHMDKWLGTICTVTDIWDDGSDNDWSWRCRIAEDDETWSWFPKAIEYARNGRVIPVDLEELI